MRVIVNVTLCFLLQTYLTVAVITDSYTPQGFVEIGFARKGKSSEEKDLEEKLSFDSDSSLESIEVNSFCLALSRGNHFENYLDQWDIITCSKLHARKIDHHSSHNLVRLPVRHDKKPLFLLAVAFRLSTKRPKVIFSSAITEQISSTSQVLQMKSSDGNTIVSAFVKLVCNRDWFGPSCTTFCQPVSEHHECDSATGKMRCVRGRTGHLCLDTVFLPRHVASQFIKRRPKRANSWHRAEEVWGGDIERECEEESCSREEAREAFEDDALTDEYWRRYIDPNQCDPNPCYMTNTVRCEDRLANYTCHCKPGFEGKNCDHMIDVCQSQPCQHGAPCTRISGTSFSCACARGYRGHVCDVNIDDCVESSCGESGICVDGINSYSCQCDPGFTGPRCETDIDECVTSPCQNGANCSDHVGYRTCNCTDDYYGVDCENRHSPCRSDPCSNDGACIMQPDFSFVCSCGSGHTGALCEHEVGSPCASEPCLNGASCYVIRNNVTEDDFMCTCAFGYGGKQCDVAIGACEFSGNPCPKNATCVDLEKQYLCVCPLGFTGEFCSVPGNDSEALERVFCGNNPCQNGARCIHNQNKTTCVCRLGFNGTHCENEINYCTSSPCINGGSCLSRPGSFMCNCAKGFEGRYCELDVDECSYPLPICHNNATCNNTIGSFQCLCGPYHVGRLCETAFDPCVSEPCQHGGMCVHGSEGFECQCVIGYGNTTCQDVIKPCEDITNRCENDAICTPREDDPRQANCTCKMGFFGRFCQKKMDFCVVRGNDTRFDNVTGAMVPVLVPRTNCGEQGDCVNERDGFRCDCHPGWVGDRCRTAYKPPVVNCTSERCQCPSRLLQELRIQHNVTSLSCQYAHYDEGICETSVCLIPPCNQSNIFCSWKSNCLNKYAVSKMSDADLASCPILELVLNATRLKQGTTVGSLCDKVRRLPTIHRFRDAVVIQCESSDRNGDNATVAVSFISITSEVDAFVMAVDTFQRLEEEIGKDTAVRILGDEIDPFFARTLLAIRFGKHLGHLQRHVDKMPNAPDRSAASSGHLSGEPSASPTGLSQQHPVIIGVPIALICLFILMLLLLLFVQRRRQKKLVQINLVTDPEFVNDVIAGDTTSHDRIAVSQNQAMWSKFTAKKNKHKSKEAKGFENPIFAETSHLSSRPSIQSNPYESSGSPFREKMTCENPLKAVEQSTVAYSVQNSPTFSARSPEEIYAKGDTVPYGAVNLDSSGESPRKTTTLGRNDPYDVIVDSPYDMAQDPGAAAKPKDPLRLDPKGLYSVAGDVSPSHGSSSESPRHGYAEIAKPPGSGRSSRKSSPVASPAKSSPVASPDRSSTASSSGVSAADSEAKASSGAPDSVDSGVETANTRVFSEADESGERYQSPKSIFPEHDHLFFPAKETEIPEIYQIPRKANPVD